MFSSRLMAGESVPIARTHQSGSTRSARESPGAEPRGRAQLDVLGLWDQLVQFPAVDQIVRAGSFLPRSLANRLMAGRCSAERRVCRVFCSSVPPLRRRDFVSGYRIDHPRIVAHSSQITVMNLPVDVHPKTCGRPLSTSPGSARRVPQDFLNLVDVDAVFGNVLNIAVRVVVQIPDDRRVDQPCLLYLLLSCNITQPNRQSNPIVQKQNDSPWSGMRAVPPNARRLPGSNHLRIPGWRRRSWRSIRWPAPRSVE